MVGRLVIRVFFQYEGMDEEVSPPPEPDLSDIPVFIKTVVVNEDDSSVTIIIEEIEENTDYDL